MPDNEAPTTTALALGAGVAAAEQGGAVMPASTLPAELGTGSGEMVVHYHLPVQIEVRAAPEPVDPDALARHALLGLARGLANT
jgi:hypothetical protein